MEVNLFKLMIKGIIFDFDGVIIDSENKSVKDNIKFLKENGLENPNIDEVKALVGTTDIDNYKYMQKVLNISYEEAKYKLEEYILAHPYVASELVYPEIYKLLEKVHGKIKTAIASNSPYAYVSSMLHDGSLEKYFQYVISGRDLGSHKPDPTIYLHTAKVIGINPDECLVVEDSPNGIEAGKRAGMTVVGRYDDFLQLDVSKADYIIKNISEIEDILIKEGVLQ